MANSQESISFPYLVIQNTLVLLSETAILSGVTARVHFRSYLVASLCCNHEKPPTICIRSKITRFM